MEKSEVLNLVRLSLQGDKYLIQKSQKLADLSGRHSLQQKF
jgi:hypothetical protein